MASMTMGYLLPFREESMEPERSSTFPLSLCSKTSGEAILAFILLWVRVFQCDGGSVALQLQVPPSMRKRKSCSNSNSESVISSLIL
ncbi:hypothetical protein CCACVL1_05111 [Corchorus capsularis]|uniref:Uncharacterized protein n=1 Tax=Corchorus capsularis TaxID=210143 RepID=A0A1R3JMR9_COCAP|nr:hypothetical protein CCACVL1_05111 [Corchorus capsularis]